MSLLWEKLIRPIMFRFDAERAHEVGIKALKNGFAAPFYSNAENFKFGPIERFGLKFPNPLGVAAGFDKNALVFNELASLGFGFVEVGTVTLKPQKGNEKPRMFRLSADQALINRLGFNNDGALAIADRLKNSKRKCIVGVNIGKNKDVPNEEAVKNYLACFEIIHSVADYIAVNVSSPNTPGLRDLQKGENLNELVSAIQTRNRKLGAKPLLLKIAPDLTDKDVDTAVDICIQHEVAGMIATNTTISREGLRTKNVESFGSGGLSGKPLADRSNRIIAQIFRKTDGKLPIIGVGGIFTSKDAFNKIASGASLVQAYTGFVYGGPTFARDIIDGLERVLDSKRFSTFDEAVGSGSQ
jgi:dihydroorotate dehydrogenase